MNAGESEVHRFVEVGRPPVKTEIPQVLLGGIPQINRIPANAAVLPCRADLVHALLGPMGAEELFRGRVGKTVRFYEVGVHGLIPTRLRARIRRLA